MTDKTGVKLEERIVYAYGGKGGDVLKNEFKTEGSFMPSHENGGYQTAVLNKKNAASTYVIF